MGRALGLDYGERRIGTALSDALGLTAQPLGVIENRKEASIAAVAALVAQHQVEAIVVGLPLHMNGTEGEKAAQAREFGSAVAVQTGVKVEFIDERLTTLAVQRMLAETQMSGQKKRKVTDKLAATLILQTWLDRKRTQAA